MYFLIVVALNEKPLYVLPILNSQFIINIIRLLIICIYVAPMKYKRCVCVFDGEHVLWFPRTQRLLKMAGIFRFSALWLRWMILQV